MHPQPSSANHPHPLSLHQGSSITGPRTALRGVKSSLRRPLGSAFQVPGSLFLSVQSSACPPGQPPPLTAAISALLGLPRGQQSLRQGFLPLPRPRVTSWVSWATEPHSKGFLRGLDVRAHRMGTGTHLDGLSLSLSVLLHGPQGGQREHTVNTHAHQLHPLLSTQRRAPAAAGRQWAGKVLVRRLWAPAEAGERRPPIQGRAGTSAGSGSPGPAGEQRWRVSPVAPPGSASARGCTGTVGIQPGKVIRHTHTSVPHSPVPHSSTQRKCPTLALGTREEAQSRRTQLNSETVWVGASKPLLGLPHFQVAPVHNRPPGGPQMQ